MVMSMSSLMTGVATVTCPTCGATLATDALDSGQAVLCSECRTRFVLRPPDFVPRISRMAIASLVLGVISLLGICLTGIPAILLGIFALRDIRQSKGQRTGRKLAIGGIVTGCLFGFLCAPVEIGLLLPAVQKLQSSLAGP